MDDESLARKYISILNDVIKSDLLSFSSKKGKDEMENSIEIWNSSNFKLQNFEFVLFFHKLEERNILRVYFYGSARMEKDGIVTNFYNDEIRNGDFATVRYGEVDAQKATQYKKELEEFINSRNNVALNKEEKKSINIPICTISKNNEILINDNPSGVLLTHRTLSILKKLIKINKNGSYPTVKTRDLMGSGNDSFRKALERLRKETKGLFKIKNIKNDKGEGCYYLEF